MVIQRSQGVEVTPQAAEVRPFVPLLPYQRADVESEDRFRWCCWARQTGKSFTKSLRRLLRGLKRGRTQGTPKRTEQRPWPQRAQRSQSGRYRRRGIVKFR